MELMALENEDTLIISSPQDLVKLLTAKRQMLLLYSVKNDVDRKLFLQNYFRNLVENFTISTNLKNEINDAINTLSTNPTTQEVDYIYQLLRSEYNREKEYINN